jgi:protein arginine N-methyltransferase 3
MSESPKPPKTKRPATPGSENSSTTGSEDQDNNWDDWVEESQGFATQSLFEDRQFPTAEAALSYDKETHNFDLVSVSTKLGSWRSQYSRSA